MPSHYDTPSRNGWYPTQCSKTGPDLVLPHLSWWRGNDHRKCFGIAWFRCSFVAIPRTRPVHVERLYVGSIYKSGMYVVMRCDGWDFFFFFVLYHAVLCSSGRADLCPSFLWTMLVCGQWFRFGESSSNADSLWVSSSQYSYGKLTKYSNYNLFIIP